MNQKPIIMAKCEVKSRATCSRCEKFDFKAEDAEELIGFCKIEKELLSLKKLTNNGRKEVREKM